MIIAAWSGPRNLSTAMMYAFAQRADCAVRDEPFYAPWLAETGADHPMSEAILAAHETNPSRVAADFRAENLLYLKLMAHHMTPAMPLGWAEDARHVHLIRHPARVIASYSVKRDAPTPEDIGFPQQLALYERFGGIVIDSADIRADPERALRSLCDALGIAFDPAMLHWPAGGNPADGAWAAHWYDAVHRSTGFADPEGSLPELSGVQQDLLEQVVGIYDHLHVRRLIPET